MKLIERTFYLDKLKDVMGTPDIKVITGIRRSGKSKLMEAFKEYIEKIEPNANIIHINFNMPEYEKYLNYQLLYEFVSSKYKPGKNNYVFIDEVQMCKGFEKAINGLHASEKYDIYITGSNAFLLSSDLATLFTGRTYEIEIFPFSFSEFMQYFELSDQYAAFNRYMVEGGMSGSFLYKSEEAKYNYIRDIFSTLIIRDIRKKYKIRNVPLLDRLCDYLIDNISNLVSARSIATYLIKDKFITNDKTISSYIKYLCDAFIFYKVRRYDIQGKRYLVSNEKYYLCDHSFKYALLGTKNTDYGRMMENIVAIELLRRGYELYIGVLYKNEIDFVAIKRSEKLYIQVAYSIDDEVTFNREVSPLLSIKDAYPKMVITRTKQPMYQYEGIKIIDVADYLLEQTTI